jgi:hypothetical protein
MNVLCCVIRPCFATPFRSTDITYFEDLKAVLHMKIQKKLDRKDRTIFYVHSLVFC